MRNDLYIGALIALGVHTTLALISPATRPLAVVAEKPPVIELKPWPVNPAEPEDPPPAGGESAKSPDNPVSPPRLPETPPVATSDRFPMRPTVVDAGAAPDPKMLTIPGEFGRGGGGGREIVDLRVLDHAPVPRFQAQPQYPFEMKRQGVAGEVLVEFIVDANGAVRDARAVRSSNREFEAAAVQAVGRWTFRPGQKDGRNVATRMQVPIVFSLDAGRG